MEFSCTIAKKTAVIASVASGLAGSMSGSSAYTLAVLSTLLLIFFFCGVHWSKRLPFVFPFAIVFPTLFAMLSFFPLSELSFFEHFPGRQIGVATGQFDDVFDLEADGGQGSARLALWQNAFSTVAASPVIGLGPGAHVPLSNVNTGTVILNEAHNTVIDLLVVTGVLGISLFFLLVSRIFFTAYKGKQLILLVACLTPVGVYSLFHFLGRQPLFWIVLCLASVTFVMLLRQGRGFTRSS
nr:O-antigen ligase family protein [Shinella fusca]